MATQAADRGMATKGVGKAPISTHPLFPAIVALWFAALLGLGSLILPTILLERLVIVTGLSSIVPQAAPPLGFTARAILALGAAGVGAVLGLVIARQIAQNHEPKPRPRFSDADARARRPISAHEELGEEGLGDRGPKLFGQKRRALAIADDGERSEYLQHVPLPGQGFGTQAPESDPEEALELGEFAEDTLPQSDQDLTMNNGTPLDPARNAATGEDQESRPEPARSAAFAKPAAARDFEDDSAEDEDLAADALPFAAPSLRRKAVPDFMSNQLGLDEDEPVEPFIEPGTFGTPGQAFAEPASLPYDPSSGASARAPQQSFDAPAASGQPRLAVVGAEPLAAAMAAAVADDRALDDLGLVQLAARLGASLERRRAQRAAGEASERRAPVFTASAEEFDAAAAEDAAAARASFFAAVQPATPEARQPDRTAASSNAEAAEPLLANKPAALRGLGFDEDDESDESDFLPSFSLPSQAAAPAPAPFARRDDDQNGYEDEGFDGFTSALDSFGDEIESETDGEDEDEDDTEYSSLLAMKNPFQKKAEFVRIDEPEPDEEDGFEATVTFPSARQADRAPARTFDPPPSFNSSPSPAASDPDDAERELRAALATLQRMSGAA